jgi:transketolase
MRTAFIDTLVDIAKENSRLFLVVGDLGFSVVEPFAKNFPERFLNIGIAEQNMTGVAAGLASEGYHVFTYSIANFPTLRCLEQIRNDVAYHNFPVTVVAVGGGLSYGSLGYSHHAVQDYAVMRTMPNMQLAAPGDPIETQACVKWLSANPQPSYLRLGKAGEPIFHTKTPDVCPGEILEFRKSKNERLVLTTGATLQYGMDFTQKTKFRDWGLASMPLWGEPCREKISHILTKYKSIIVLEDHLCAGGFGSFILETKALYDIKKAQVRAVSLNVDVCGRVMGQHDLNSFGGLNANSIAVVADSLC